MNESAVVVTTDVLAKNVFLLSDKDHFRDNYFDLLPGEKKIIIVEESATDITVKSLFDVEE